MINLNIIVFVDRSLLSENGEETLTVTKENTQFLEELAKTGLLFFENSHSKIFHNISSENKIIFFPRDTLNDTLRDIQYLHRFHDDREPFVIFGTKLLQEFITTRRDLVNRVYLFANNELMKICDIPYFFNLSQMIIRDKKETTVVTKYVLEYGSTFETQYMQIMKNLIRTKNIKNGRNGLTKSIFGGFMRFDLRDGFPLLTSRKMFFRGIVEELLFFIRGDTNTKLLEKNGVNIWKRNTNQEFLKNVGLNYEEGMMGPLYGAQWRHFGGKYDSLSGRSEGGVDQLANVVELIQKESDSRRIIMTSFNPSQADEAVLYPCHSVVLQFYVENDFLDLLAFSRSIDWFHGAPFNIAMYSLLLILVAKLTGHIARVVNITFGDSHIYSIHEEACKELINRPIYQCPKLIIEKNILTIEDIENMKFEDFVLENYLHHDAIKVEMVS